MEGKNKNTGRITQRRGIYIYIYIYKFVSDTWNVPRPVSRPH